ncbi:MAG: VWA domain-containing protein [Flavobacteriales bacterium]|nr:VWA domain-containing protein [Flavobacteriales bacterium]
MRSLLLLLPVLLTGLMKAQDGRMTRMLFVMDASNSMNAFWGNKPKINTARELLLDALVELEDRSDIEIALRLYGHQTPIEPGKQDCDDTKLEVPFGPRNIPVIRRTLEQVRCVGTTPIARSLERAAKDFEGTTDGRNIIILITDGIEACDEDPCAVSRALQAKGITLKPFVIGVGLDENSRYSLECIGNYYDASSPALFEHVLQVVIAQALNNTTAQVDLLTVDGEPTETNVAISMYDQRSGELRYQFMHTLNERGRPDTLTIDPVYTYRVVVHTLPPVVREGVELRPGIHNTIPIAAGQGGLEIKSGSGVAEPFSTPCIIRERGNTNTLHVQAMNSTDRYLVGMYDVEVLSLPRLHIQDVKVEQGGTAQVQVPRPGVLNVRMTAPGDGALFQVDGSELLWVADLNPSGTGDQFRLLPGSYKLTYRSKNARRSEYSMTKEVTIESGRSVNLDL